MPIARIAQALMMAGLTMIGAMAGPMMVHSAVPQVRITPDRELDFGVFMVFGNGSRTVSTTGAVTDVAISSLEGRLPQPARFTVSYDRGNESNHRLNVELQLVVSTLPPFQQAGLAGTVSALQSDLPGATQVAPGQPISVSLLNCRTRVCSRSFNMGGRLDVSRQFGGGQVVVPIPIDVAVLSVVRL